MTDHPLRPTGRPGRRSRILAAVVATGLLLAGCSAAPADDDPEVLRIGIPFPPSSLDPAQTAGQTVWYLSPAYDPLIFMAPDGTLQPRLAESWGYVDDEMTVFEITLRDGVEFSDGSALTAELVVANLERAQEVGGQPAAKLSAVAGFEAVDELTLRLELSRPDPTLERALTQNGFAGFIAGETALDDPGLLATQTVGAGPYVLDSDQSIEGDTYVFVPNEGYWNPEGRYFDEVQFKVIPNANTALSALQTGQVDIITSEDPSTAAAAEASGLTVTANPGTFAGLTLADRDGTLVPALADVRVRQALNYAIDREAITAAVFGEYAVASDQIVAPGTDGYNDEVFFEYDPEKARELLTEAGYADGFTMTVVSTPIANIDDYLQAMADQYAAVGVTLEIKSNGDPNGYFADMASTAYPAYGITFGIDLVHVVGPSLFIAGPGGAQFNPFQSSDPEIEAWFAEAAGATPEERAELDREIIAKVTEDGWFVTLALKSLLFYSSPDIAGVEASPANPIPNPLDWRPAN